MLNKQKSKSENKKELNQKIKKSSALYRPSAPKENHLQRFPPKIGKQVKEKLKKSERKFEEKKVGEVMKTKVEKVLSVPLPSYL